MNILIIGDSYQSFIAAIAIKINNPLNSVTILGDVQAREGKMHVIANPAHFFDLLGISRETFFYYSDATICSALCIQPHSQEANTDFYLASGQHGISDEVVDFHLLYLLVDGIGKNYDSFSGAAQLAKYGKVNSPLSNKGMSLGQGLNINEAALCKLLEFYTENLKINVIKDKVAIPFVDTSGNCSVTDAANQSYPADLVLDVRKNIRFSERYLFGHYISWDHFFSYKKERISFNPGQIDTRPLCEIAIADGSIVKKIPVRSGVSYEYWRAVDTVETLTDNVLLQQSPEYGRAENSWVGNYIQLGSAAASTDDLLISEVDVLIENLFLLLKLWPGSISVPALTQEFNRRVNILFDSVRDYHLIFYWLIRKKNLSVDVGLPKSAFDDLCLFTEAGRLVARDERYPPYQQWVSCLMGWKYFPKRKNSIMLSRNIDQIKIYLNAQQNDIEKFVNSSQSHVNFVKLTLASLHKNMR